MLQGTCWQTRSTTLSLLKLGPQDTHAEDRQVSRSEDEDTGGTGSVETRCRHVVSLSKDLPRLLAGPVPKRKLCVVRC